MHAISPITNEVSKRAGETKNELRRQYDNIVPPWSWPTGDWERAGSYFHPGASNYTVVARCWPLASLIPTLCSEFSAQKNIEIKLSATSRPSNCRSTDYTSCEHGVSEENFHCTILTAEVPRTTVITHLLNTSTNRHWMCVFRGGVDNIRSPHSNRA